MEDDPIVLFNIFFAKKNEIQPDAGKSLIYRNSQENLELTAQGFLSKGRGLIMVSLCEFVLCFLFIYFFSVMYVVLLVGFATVRLRSHYRCYRPLPYCL